MSMLHLVPRKDQSWPISLPSETTLLHNQYRSVPSKQLVKWIILEGGILVHYPSCKDLVQRLDLNNWLLIDRDSGTVCRRSASTLFRPSILVHSFNCNTPGVMSSSSTPGSALLPHFHLLCMEPKAALAWEAAIEHYKLSSSPHMKYTIHDTALSQLPPSLQFDAVVSPANSYAILDGGFDDAISRAWSPQDDYLALTRHAQAHLYATHRGYLPPGQAQVVHNPGPQRGSGKLRYHDGQGWGCRYLILCPTMRMPSACDWDKEVVYECVWSLLNAVERHNASVADGKGGEGGEDPGRGTRIESILMTPLGTGTGRVSYERWARQVVLAIKHWVHSAENPEKFMSREWRDLAVIEAELVLTHRI